MDALTPAFERTRRGLHAVAEKLVAPSRKPDNEIALYATPGGFGTPVFAWEGETHQVRVDGTELVRFTGATERRVRIESLAQSAELLADLIPDPPTDDAPLELDPADAAALAGWYELGEKVLTALVKGLPEDGPILWPEHFDIAIVVGDEAAGRRANVGFSPGDDDHAEPYLYVGPWDQDVSGALWNATGFTGAEMGYEELAASEVPEEAALEFCRERLAALGG